MMVYYFFSLFPLLPLWGDDQRPVLGPPFGGQGLARSEPWPALHARSLDVRDARSSSTASRGRRLVGGSLELSSRRVEGILVFGGGMERGKGGGEKVFK